MEQEKQIREEHESLNALREHVSKAVDEIVRLRAQNTSLARRLSQLESDGSSEAIAIGGTTNPDELRATISGFIDSIDRYLAGNDRANSED